MECKIAHILTHEHRVMYVHVCTCIFILYIAQVTGSPVLFYFCYVMYFPLYRLIVEIVLNVCYQMVYNDLTWTLCIHFRLNKLLET